MTTLAAMLKAGEGETLEFKEQWNPAALESLAAFANHKGGTVLVGVRDDGQVAGFPDDDKERQKIANQIADVLGLRPRVRRAKHGRKAVLSVKVAPSLMPVACRGRYLTRVGSVNREMTPDQIARRFVEKLGQTWDALPSAVKPGEIDPEAVRHFVRLAAKRLPQLTGTDPPQRILENLELIQDGVLTNAAVLLFVRRPQRLFAVAQTHIGRFRGSSIEDDRTARGTLWEQLDAALTAFRTYLQKRLEVQSEQATVEGIQREDVWEYPLDALREAVVNALIHRDYAALGEIQIRVHQDSIEVWNPGGLPEGVTLQDLRREGHTSRPRNPLLAQTFYYAGLVERWGTGTTRMIKACREHGLPEPRFAEHSGGFAVAFEKDPYTAERLKTMGLNERQMKAVLHVKEHGSVTNQQYTKMAGVSKATATRDLEALVTRDLFLREGVKGPGTRYRLKGSGLAQLAQERLKKGSKGSTRGRG